MDANSTKFRSIVKNPYSYFQVRIINLMRTSNNSDLLKLFYQIKRRDLKLNMAQARLDRKLDNGACQ